MPALLPDIRVKGRKYSSQMKEYEEYDHHSKVIHSSFLIQN